MANVSPDGPPSSVAMRSARPPPVVVSPADVAARLGALGRERLERLTFLLGLVYLPVAASHLVLLPAAALPAMLTLALVSAALLLMAARRLRAGASWPTATTVNPLVYACIIAHSLARLVWAHAPADMMFVGVIAVGIALIPGSMALHVLALCVYLGGWSGLMVRADGSAALLPYVAPLLVTAAISVLVRHLELARQRRLLELQLLDVKRKEALEVSEEQRRDALESLHHEVRHDALTGMLNRVSFTDLLDRTIADPETVAQSFAVLYLDLDRFKLINDSLGHDVGDRLLQAVSERLLRFVRPGDAVARFAGDEFGVLLGGLRAPSDALLVAERVHTLFEESFRLNDYDVELGASIGIATHRAEYRDANEMLRDADLAMSEAKETSEKHRLFDGDMHARAVERLKVEVELRRALREHELEVHYQPVVRMKDGVPVGLEALVRWRHPERGLLLPAEFLPLAERTGLIVELGRWVLGRATRDLAAWRRELQVPPSFVSINISPRHFAQPDFEAQVHAALNDSGVEPREVWLEITEGAVMDEPDMAEQRIARLSAMGVIMAVDDFGVGYSSLGYLQRFAFSVIKLDRSFVELNHKNVHLLDAMVRIARGLEMTLVAEGLEEIEQIDRLRALGVELGQGYHFARPMPARDVPDSLRPPSGTASDQSEQLMS